MPRGTHSLQGLRCGCGEVCAKSCQTGCSFQKNRMVLQALCTSDDYTPRCLIKSWHGDSCREYNTLLCTLWSVSFMIAVHVLVNDSLDSIFQEVYPNQELKVKKPSCSGRWSLWGGDTCLQTSVEFTLSRDVGLNFSLLVLRVWIGNVDLAHVGKVWIFSSSVESFLLTCSSWSWLSLGSSLSLYSLLPVLTRRLSVLLLSSRCYPQLV